MILFAWTIGCFLIVFVRFLCLMIRFGDIGFDNFVNLDIHPFFLRNSAMSFSDL